MLENVLFQKILLSLAIGALIGLERERRVRGKTFAGIRTFMLVSLFGLLTGYLSEIFANYLPIYIGLFSVGALSVSSYLVKYYSKKLFGLTTEIALLITFVIGLLFFFESYPYFLPISLGIILTFVLLLKEPLHGFARQLKRNEIRDAVIFAILVFIILPLLPNKPIDPFGFLNPYVIWLAIVLVLSVSFVAYVAMKIFGTKKGLALTGLFGGFVSSTAVAISMAQRAKNNKRIIYSAAFATIIASSTMFFRQLVISSVFNFNLIFFLIPLAVLGVVGYLMSYLPLRKGVKEKTSVEIGSPLTLRPAFQFAIFFTIVLFISHLIKTFFGESAVYLLALVAGLIDVDATTISIASLTSLSPMIAAKGIILAGLSNTFSKLLLINLFGTKKMFTEVGKIFLSLIVIGTFLLFI